MIVKTGGPTRSRARAMDTVASPRVARAVSDRSPVAAAAGNRHRFRHARDASAFSSAVASHLGRPAPLDLAKVHAVRAAILDGSYRVDAREIARRIMESGLQARH